jgi:hypothetical protein
VPTSAGVDGDGGARGGSGGDKGDDAGARSHQAVQRQGN